MTLFCTSASHAIHHRISVPVVSAVSSPPHSHSLALLFAMPVALVISTCRSAAIDAGMQIRADDGVDGSVRVRPMKIAMCMCACTHTYAYAHVRHKLSRRICCSSTAVTYHITSHHHIVCCFAHLQHLLLPPQISHNLTQRLHLFGMLLHHTIHSS